MGRDILLSTNSHIFEINVRDNLYQAKQGLNLKRNETIQLSVRGLHNYTFAGPFKNRWSIRLQRNCSYLERTPGGMSHRSLTSGVISKLDRSETLSRTSAFTGA